MRHFSLTNRIQKFRQNLLHIKWPSSYFWGWLLSMAAIVISISLQWDAPLFFLYVIHGFYLYKFLPWIYKNYHPPIELLLLFFFILFFLDVLIISISPPVETLSSLAYTILLVPHTTLVLLLFSTFSMIIIYNARGKCLQVGAFVFLLSISFPLIPSTSYLAKVLFFLVLFLFLLKQTRWLEELGKTESWVYLLISFVLFVRLSDWNPVPLPRSDSSPAAAFVYASAFFYWMIFQYYLLAIAVKIPIVMIYNHARLSRKLWLSGLFQSTMPQLIQLAILLLMFYFLISGWQAERFRASLLNALDENSMITGSQPVLRVPVSDAASETTLRIPGYEPVRLQPPLPVNGIIALEKPADDTDYFVFKTGRDARDQVFFAITRIDSQLVAEILRHTPIFLGNQILAYPLYLTSWQKWLFRLEILGREDEISFFPFSILSQPAAEVMLFRFAAGQDSDVDNEFQLEFNAQNLPNPIFGRIISPIFDSTLQQTGFFAFDISFFPQASFFLSPIFRFMLLLIIIYFIINLFVIRRVVKFGSEINQTIVHKFNHLKKGIQEIARGNLDYQVEMEGEDEFLELANHFNRLGGRLKQSIQEMREKERLEQELKIARQVQLSMLPKKLPEVPHFEIAATLRTANEVGGDFYDVVPVGNGSVLFTVGDVSGKSTSAAFYMAQCLSLIRFSPQFTTDPVEILKRLNQYFSNPLVDRHIFVTLVLGSIANGGRTVEFVRAGHPPPLIIPAAADTPIYQIEPNGMGVGLARKGDVFEQSLEKTAVHLYPGDTMILYSDGVIEASTLNSPTGEPAFYGETRFRQLLESLRGESAAGLLSAVLDDLNAFYQESSPADDYTLMILQRKS